MQCQEFVGSEFLDDLTTLFGAYVMYHTCDYLEYIALSLCLWFYSFVVVEIWPLF
jgi:hypothetical protein